MKESLTSAQLQNFTENFLNADLGAVAEMPSASAKARCAKDFQGKFTHTTEANDPACEFQIAKLYSH